MGMGVSEVRLMVENAPEDVERAVVVGSDGELGRSKFLPTSRSDCEGCTVMPWEGVGIRDWDVKWWADAPVVVCSEGVEVGGVVCTEGVDVGGSVWSGVVNDGVE